MNEVIGGITSGENFGVGILILLIILRKIVHTSTLPERAAARHDSDTEQHDSVLTTGGVISGAASTATSGLGAGAGVVTVVPTLRARAGYRRHRSVVAVVTVGRKKTERNEE